ncbi:hypothetical protein [Candidatus Kuenenia stuttgartiensis]|nr:hypothetical protein [Candidatus Kuenenia stuttgartiensis]
MNFEKMIYVVGSEQKPFTFVQIFKVLELILGYDWQASVSCGISAYEI